MYMYMCKISNKQLILILMTFGSQFLGLQAIFPGKKDEQMVDIEVTQISLPLSSKRLSIHKTHIRFILEVISVQNHHITKSVHVG